MGRGDLGFGHVDLFGGDLALDVAQQLESARGGRGGVRVRSAQVPAELSQFVTMGIFGRFAQQRYASTVRPVR